MPGKGYRLDERVPLALSLSCSHANPVVAPEPIRFDEYAIAIEKHAVANCVDCSCPVRGRWRGIEKHALERAALKRVWASFILCDCRRDGLLLETFAQRTPELFMDGLTTAEITKDLYPATSSHSKLEGVLIIRCSRCCARRNGSDIGGVANRITLKIDREVDIVACSQWSNEKFEILPKASKPGPTPAGDWPTWHSGIPSLTKIANDQNRP